MNNQSAPVVQYRKKPVMALADRSALGARHPGALLRQAARVGAKKRKKKHR